MLTQGMQSPHTLSGSRPAVRALINSDAARSSLSVGCRQSSVGKRSVQSAKETNLVGKETVLVGRNTATVLSAVQVTV